jgi:hypothetical protein
MDNTALARALERFVIAEPERRLPILRQIIKKFDPARYGQYLQFSILLLT